MSNRARLIIDLFAEDRAHEQFVSALVRRLAREANVEITLRAPSVRGGHGKAVSELKLFQRARAITQQLPDMLVVVIDANCGKWRDMRNTIEADIEKNLFPYSVVACPDPHIERWYLADQVSLSKLFGTRTVSVKRKCERDYYKKLLADVLQEAGHPVVFGGVEYAEEIVASMDFFRAGKTSSSLKHFVDTLCDYFRAHSL